MAERGRVSVILTSVLCVLQLPMGTDEAESSLRLVNILFRHGDRSPMIPLPGSDLYKESDWPQGYAQLSTIGIQQEYQLGHFLRDRYDGFLSKRYSRKEVYVESTDTERTLMSIQAVTAALYKPEGAQTWNPDIMWQPIPAHPASWIQKRPADCEAGERGKKVEKELRQKYKDVFETVEAGLNIKLQGTGTLWSVYDTLFCQELHNKTWPGWVSDELMRLILEDLLPNYCRKTYSHTKNRADVLYKMVTEMKSYVANNQASNIKAYFYSGHDTNVLCLLSALETYNDKMVPYATAVILELHYGNITNNQTERDRGLLYEDRGEEEGPERGEEAQEVEEMENNMDVEKAPQWFVQVWLRNDSTRGPYKLTVPGCNSDCAWEDFIKLTSTSINDLLRDPGSCHESKMKLPSHLWEAVLGMLGVGGVLMITMTAVSLVCLYKHRKRRQRLQAILYRQLNTEDIPMSDTG